MGTKVCIVGAGVSGLCALRHFRSKPETFSVCTYEQSQFIGGIWKYTDQTGLDDNGKPIHSSMYKNLRTNLPMQIMEFPDFKSNYIKSYVHHSKVHEYLTRYCQHFNLFPFIQFNHRVKCIRREEFDWTVTVTDTERNVTSTQRFDVLVLCVGRFSRPHLPQYPTLHRFNGKVLHSHDYRVPETFAGQTVAVIGGGMSGVDICLEISVVAKQIVFINRNKPEQHFKNLPANVSQLYAEVDHFDATSMYVLDLEEESKRRFGLDAIVFATGYLVNLEFLDKSCGVQSENDGWTVSGLYRHMINMKYPSMMIVDIVVSLLSFPLFDYQIQFFIETLLGNVKLPSLGAMRREIEEEKQERFKAGMKLAKYCHNFNTEMAFKYLDRICTEAGLVPFPKSIQKIYHHVLASRNADIRGYKTFNYRVVSDDEFQIEKKDV